jgi:hypothetical protein
MNLDQYGVQIGVKVWQSDSPPLWRRMGVSISRGYVQAVIPAGEALRLASAIEAVDPGSAAQLREAADEVRDVTGRVRDDPLDEIEGAEYSPEESDLARRLLGISQPEA